jgi:hypothetical protein
MADERETLTDDELERWWRDAYEPDVGIGVQVRNRKIRRLIDELRRLRQVGAGQENEGAERAIVGALRSAINDHGPITPETIGSAAKRIVGNLRNG